MMVKNVIKIHAYCKNLKNMLLKATNPAAYSVSPSKLIPKLPWQYILQFQLKLNPPIQDNIARNVIAKINNMGLLSSFELDNPKYIPENLP